MTTDPYSEYGGANANVNRVCHHSLSCEDLSVLFKKELANGTPAADISAGFKLAKAVRTKSNREFLDSGRSYESPLGGDGT